MTQLTQLLKQNRQWVARVCRKNPDFFHQLSKRQQPKYLWIGCSDSRVPANEILGLLPGDIFVHRNVANVVVHSDLNCLAVLQYAVDVLKIEHILVCGHYGCGGIQAATLNESHGLVDNWLRHVQDVASKHQTLLSSFNSESVTEKDVSLQKNAVMCELNVVEQVINAAKTTVIEEAWKRGQSVTIYGVIYALSNGLLQEIDSGIQSAHDVEQFYQQALQVIKENLWAQKM